MAGKSASRTITIDGLLPHTARPVSCKFLHNKINLICGPAGSGKRSLVIDVLHAECMARLELLRSVESTNHKREPDATPWSGTLAGLTPIIRITGQILLERRKHVATFLGLTQILFELAENAAERICPRCESKIASPAEKERIDQIISNFKSRLVAIVAMSPRELLAESLTLESLIKFTRSTGFSKILIESRIIDLDDEAQLQSSLQNFTESNAPVGIIIDRLRISEGESPRLADSLHQADRLSADRISVVDMEENPSAPLTVDRSGTCQQCRFSAPGMTPEIFLALLENRKSHDEIFRSAREELYARRIGELTFRSILNEAPDKLLSKWTPTPAQPLKEKFEFLESYGLGHIPLARRIKDCSSGERIMLGLVHELLEPMRDITYVLEFPPTPLQDEPILMINGALKDLTEIGNTVILVDGKEDQFAHADHVQMLGKPFQQEIFRDTAPIPHILQGKLTLSNIRHKNLNGIGIEIPSPGLTCIVGECGSGKSALVTGVVVPAVKEWLRAGKPSDDAWHKDLNFQTAHIDSEVASVVGGIAARYLNQSESTVASYSGILTELSSLLAMSELARMRGLTKESFKRTGNGYSTGILDVTYRGLNIAQFLALTISQISSEFSLSPSLRRILKAFEDMGLGYLTLAQPLSRLAPGEYERGRAARALARSGRASLFALDRPGMGLDAGQLNALAGNFTAMARSGHTVVIADNNPELIKASNYIIELGFEGRTKSGVVIASGAPSAIAQGETATGLLLRQFK